MTAQPDANSIKTFRINFGSTTFMQTKQNHTTIFHLGIKGIILKRNKMKGISQCHDCALQQKRYNTILYQINHDYLAMNKKQKHIKTTSNIRRKKKN